MSVEFKEGDRVQYKIDLASENLSEGTIQKVLKGGESLREVSSTTTHEFIPRYVYTIGYMFIKTLLLCVLFRLLRIKRNTLMKHLQVII